MSEPAGPTGVITLKKIGDMTYEQYGAIVLSSTSITQVTASASTLDTIFQPDIEQRMTWVEDFGSRIRHNEVTNANRAAWQSGAWQSQGGINKAFTDTGLLDGAGRLFLQAISSALPNMNVRNTEGETLPGDNRATTHVNRNPIFYIRWAQSVATSSGQMAIGWVKQGGSLTNLDMATASNGVTNAIYLKHGTGTEIIGCCRTTTPPGSFNRSETTLSMGVSASAGVYHTARMVCTGAGAAVEFFLDGESRGVITTDIPRDVPDDFTFALWPTFGSSNNNVFTIDVDYMAVSQQRTPG